MPASPGQSYQPANSARDEQSIRNAQQELAQLRAARAALDAAATQLNQLRAQLIQEAHGQVVSLAIEIARKVMMQEIAAGRYEIDPIVQESLRSVPTRAEIVVHLNPADWQRCRLAGEQDAASTNVRFVADANVQPAQCILETSEGVVESQLDAHLDEIANQLTSAE